MLRKKIIKKFDRRVLAPVKRPALGLGCTNIVELQSLCHDSEMARCVCSSVVMWTTFCHVNIGIKIK